MLDDELAALVGATSSTSRARHPVGATAIADWCDAIGDTNPCFTDPDYAATSRHGGLVAPPAMLDVWDRPGLPAQAGPSAAATDPRSRAMRRLDEAGYVGVVAVNSELEILRYLRLGEWIGHDQVLESVSECKQTVLGTGYFLTTRHRYRTTDGEPVGSLLFRLLKFRPGTGATREPDPVSPAAPDPDPARRPRPAVNRDNAAIWEGYRSRQLRVQVCRGCAGVLNPPAPRCGRCGSFESDLRALTGRWSLYSYAVVHHPQVAGFRYPLPVGLVEHEDGTRVVATLDGARPEQLRVGLDLVLDWLPADESWLPTFRPAPPVPRVETLRLAEVAAGDVLAPWLLPVSATLVVSGALATRDFQDVHHDRDLARAKGSRDIFLNINTSVGLLARYVSDWTGPQALVRALRVRLGAQAHPGLPLSFEGRVSRVDRDRGRVELVVSATNALGPHVSATVELELDR